jgi:EAL domain-containing protein (putative c-di-GMP-specific phosphodiesterase class I)
MKEPMHATLELEADLNQALSRKEFEIYYQPIVSVLSGKIVGIEALLRWNHPVHGLLSPATFIPICEENGLIIPIGQWVLNTACLQMKAWYDKGYVDLHVAINLSARQFNDPELLKMILQVLETTKLAPHCLELELTESLIVQDPKKNAVILTALQNLGVQLAMDDFGTGYSSLSYFKKFKFNTLKIDKSFIDDLAISHISEAIVAAIISLGKSVGLTVLAEGVEKAEQLDLLKKYDCDFMQGYFFSKPLPVDKMIALLKNESGE